MPRPDHRFVEVNRADYPLLRRWLAEPHVRATWGEPDVEIALVDQELDGGDCRMHVVHHEDSPIGFIQDWCPQLAGVPHMTDLPKGIRAIDTFLGAASHLGKGHAKAYVRKYAETLLATGAPMVATDPHLTNPRGIAMYRAAGFRDHARRRCETGDMAQIFTYPVSSV